ncbi:MAG: FAD-binding oxidoreductase, partial [Planctomycetota bacterium]
ADGAVHGARLTDGPVLEADTTVIAAGGWAGRLGERAGSRLALTPLRRHLLVTQVDGRVDPRWPIVWDERAGFYARPESGGLLLCACDQTEVDPDACVADPGVKATIARKALRLLPGFANAGATHFWAGMRTFAGDADPVIGPDADVPGLFWVAALAGHGMSTSAAVGQRAARALLGEPPAATGDGSTPGRFTSGSRVHGSA